MSAKLRVRRPSPAMLVAVLALFVALGGSSYAALKVGSKQIVNNSVRSKDIRNNDVRSGDVRNGSLLSTDFKPGQLPAGARGPKGDKGDQGPAGAPNPNAINAQNADKLDGKDSADFLPASAGTLWAVVNSDGSLRRGKGVTSAQLAGLSPTFYQVTFDRDVSACAITASIARTATFNPGFVLGQITADSGVAGGFPPQVVVVRTGTETGGSGQRDFTLHVAC